MHRYGSRVAAGVVTGGGRPCTPLREAGAARAVAAGGRPRAPLGRAIRARWTRLAKNDSCEDVEGILVFLAWT